MPTHFIVAVVAAQASGQEGTVLDRLVRTLGEERQHRVAASPSNAILRSTHRGSGSRSQRTSLERDGRLFAAGPLLNDEYRFHGPGLIILNVDSRAEAERIVATDPFHARGIRTWRLVPWQVNEGSLGLRLVYSNSTFALK